MPVTTCDYFERQEIQYKGQNRSISFHNTLASFGMDGNTSCGGDTHCISITSKTENVQRHALFLFNDTLIIIPDMSGNRAAILHIISSVQPNSASHSAEHRLAERPSRRNLWISRRLTSHHHSHGFLDLCVRVVREHAASEILLAVLSFSFSHKSHDSKIKKGENQFLNCYPLDLDGDVVTGTCKYFKGCVFPSAV